MATIKDKAKKAKTATSKMVTKKVTGKTTKPTTDKKVIKKKKTQAAALDSKNIKETVKKIVTSEREVKYNYPEGIDNQLDRKSWRAKVRTKLRQYESKIHKEKDKTAKAKLEKQYNNYRKEVLLVP